MKKIFLKLCTVLLSLTVIPSLAFGSTFVNSISQNQVSLWKLTGTAILPYSTSATLGSPSVPISNGYFTNLFASSTSFTRAGGALDMGGFPITDAGSTTATGFISTTTQGNGFLGQNGSAAYPTYAFSNAPNTGIYNGVTAIDLSINGARAFEFDPGGQMFGAANNQINMPASGAISVVAAGTNQSITLTPSGTGEVLLSGGSIPLFFTQKSGSGGIFNTTNGSGSGFYLNGSGVGASAIIQTSNATALTINSSQSANFAGNVGLSSSTPWGQLSVNPSALGTGIPEFVVGSSTTTHFLVDGAGNVAIGKTVASAGFVDIDAKTSNLPALTLNRNDASQNFLTLKDNGTTQFGIDHSAGSNTSLLGTFGLNLSSGSNFHIQLNPGGTGKVGISTSTPSAPLSVTGVATNNFQFYISSTTATVASTTLFAIDKQGNILTSGTPPLSVTCAATCAFDAHSNDMAGTINIAGAQTSITVNFRDTKPWVPHCVVSDSSTATTYEPSTISTTQVIFTTALSLGTGYITYYCPL